jgi:branched-chain amino acid transport system permease protein
VRSGGYLLFTFLGGATFFFGPIIGAVLLVFASVMLSELTKAWLLYLGLVFLLMVMFAPGGIASLIMMNLRVAKFGKLKGLLGVYVTLVLAGAVLFLGIAAAIEMVYHLQLNDSLGATVHFLGLSFDAKSPTSWIAIAAVIVVGAVLFTLARRRFARRWSDVQSEIEAILAQKAAA